MPSIASRGRVTQGSKSSLIPRPHSGKWRRSLSTHNILPSLHTLYSPHQLGCRIQNVMLLNLECVNSLVKWWHLNKALDVAKGRMGYVRCCNRVAVEALVFVFVCLPAGYGKSFCHGYLPLYSTVCTVQHSPLPSRIMVPTTSLWGLAWWETNGQLKPIVHGLTYRVLVSVYSVDASYCKQN